MLFFKKKNKKLESEEISETVKNFFYNNKENPSEIRAVNLTKFYGKRKIIEDISYDKKDKEQEKIMKTTKILMNKEIYSACYI